MFSGASIDLQITFPQTTVCKLFGIEAGAKMLDGKAHESKI